MKYSIGAVILISLIFASQFTLTEVNEAIEYIEHSKNTHVIWRAHIIGQQMTLNESAFNEWYKEHKYAGTIESHEECIRRYDHVLDVLYRMQGILNYTSLSFWFSS
jgi:hypothetical protein